MPHHHHHHTPSLSSHHHHHQSHPIVYSNHHRKHHFQPWIPPVVVIRRTVEKPCEPIHHACKPTIVIRSKSPPSPPQLKTVTYLEQNEVQTQPNKPLVVQPTASAPPEDQVYQTPPPIAPFAAPPSLPPYGFAISPETATKTYDYTVSDYTVSEKQPKKTPICSCCLL